MPFDGFFDRSKTVPKRPTRYPPSRPYKPPIRRPPSERPTWKPSKVPRPSPKPLGSPSPYGTAVPTSGAPVMTGMPRHVQFLRWFRPNPLQDFAWNYALTWTPVFMPGFVGSPAPVVPDGWASCGNLSGQAIPYYEGPIYPGYPPPFLCRFLPIGGQVEPIPNPNPDPPSYLFWGPGELIGTTLYGPSNGLMYKIAGEGAPLPKVEYSGGTTWLPEPSYPRVWPADPRPGQHLVPWADQPTQPVAESPHMGPARGNTHDSYFRLPEPPGRPDRPNRPPPGNPHGPPGPRTKERKGKVPPWFAKLVAAGFEVTEAVDLVDNLFDCLPKAVQKKAPKTGTTLPDAWRPGIKYTTALDRARHVYNNIDKLDLGCAAKNIACNHVTDMLWGRFFGAVDTAARRHGITAGFGNASGSLDGLNITKKDREEFEQWISSQPALDALRKSLPC